MAVRKAKKVTVPHKGMPVGEVMLNYPSESYPYFRISWTDPATGKRVQTSAGKDATEALALANTANTRLARRVGKLGIMSLDACIADYTSKPQVGINTSTVVRTNTYVIRKRRLLRAVKLANKGKVLCQDIDIDCLDQIRGTGSTDRTEREITIDLRALLDWGYRAKYFSREQLALLPKSPPVVHKRGSNQSPRATSTVPGSRRGVTDAHAPTHSEIKKIASAIGKYYSLGELAIELAAATGLRWGEQFALLESDIDLVNREIKVDRAIVLHRAAVGGNLMSRCGPPKNRKTRVVVFPEQTLTGYDLLGAMRQRMTQIKADMTAYASHKQSNPSTEPQQPDLLFPSPGGGLFWHTTWSNDMFKKAAKDAGWVSSTHKDKGTRLNPVSGEMETFERKRTLFQLTHHSLRHRWALDMLKHYKMDEDEVCVLGGWANVIVLRSIYGRPNTQTQTSALENARRLTSRNAPIPKTAKPVNKQQKSKLSKVKKKTTTKKK